MLTQLSEINLGIDIDFGSPARLFLSEMKLVLYLERDESTVFSQKQTLPDEVLLLFAGCIYHSFGPPTAVNICTHRYASIGLMPYKLYSVSNSEIIRGFMESDLSLKASDSILNHYIIPLGDDTLEVICHKFSVHVEKRK